MIRICVDSKILWQRAIGVAVSVSLILIVATGCTDTGDVNIFPGTGGPDPIDGGRPPNDGLTWDFGRGDQGWTLFGGTFVDNTRPGWSAGSLKLSGSGEGPWYFVSPSSFSGNQSEVYGKLLQFTLSRDTSCRDRMPGEVWQGLVVLNGGGWSIGWGQIDGTQHDFSGKLIVRLDESDTWIVVGSPDPAVPVGSRANRGVFDTILSHLSDLRIFGQRGYCDGVTTLDDVKIGQ